MLILLLLLFVSTLAAQTGPPTLTAIFATSTKAGSIGDRSLSIHATMTGGEPADYNTYDIDAQHGTDSTLTIWRRYPIGAPAGSSDDSSQRWVRIQDLEPGSTVYIRLRVTNSAGTFTAVPACTATCTNCTSSDDPTFGDNGSGGSGFDCVDGEIARITMASLDSGAPVAPTAPTHSFSATIPAADNTHVIDGTCSNWATQRSAAIAAAEASGTTERIEIPPGVTCPCFQLTSLSDGRVQVTTGADPEVLPQPGTMVHPGYAPQLGVIAHPAGSPGNWTNTCITMEAVATGWDLFALAFTEPPGTDPSGYPATRASSLISTADGGGSTNSTGLRFDRLLIDFPSDWDLAAVFNLTNSIDITITNSWVRRDLTDEGGSLQFSVYIGGTDDAQIINNNFLVLPFILGDTSTRQVGPLTLKGNILHASDIYSNQHPDFGGIEQFFTYLLELKNCEFCEISGNFFKGGRADFNANNGTCAITGVSQSDAHIEMRSNTFKQTDSGCAFSDNNVPGPFRPIYPSERLWIHNNLMFGASREYGDGTGVTTGAFLAFWSPAEDTVVTRNTYHVKSGVRPIIAWIGDRGQGHQDEKNIYTFTGGGSGNRGVRRLLGGTSLPAPSAEDGSAAWDETFISGTAADTLSFFRDNKIIPGVENSQTSPSTKYDSVTDSETISCAEAIADATLSTFADLECIGSASACGGGPCPDSMEDRMNLAFEPGSWRPKAALSGYGADIDVLERDQLRTRNVQVEATGTSATITWDAPGSTGCLVQLAPWETSYNTTFSEGVGVKDPDMAEQTDAGGDTDQTVTFGSLDALTKYGYRITGAGCPKERPGTFTTAG